MKSDYHLSGVGLISACLFLATAAQLRAQLGRGEVQGLSGEATYAFSGGAPVRVVKGAPIPPGSLIRTGRDSAVDLYFGPEAGTVRLTQNTVLSLDKLERTQTMLTLAQGSMIGWGANVPANSEYQVKLPNGIVGIVEGKYRLDARSYLVLLNGAMAFAYVAADGQPRPYPLKAPPAVYFSPIEGVKPAPLPLQREVELQSKGKLR